MRPLSIATTSLLLLATSLVTGAGESAAKCGGGGTVTATIGNYGTGGAAKCPKPAPKPRENVQGASADLAVNAPKIQYDHAWAIACPGFDVATLVSGATVGDSCGVANAACVNRGVGTNRLIYRRVQGSTGPWVPIGTTCGSNPSQGAPPPPPIPTVAQIQQAFRQLPFAKPTVNIQPEGDVTLVNLPTYFEAQWPTGKLGPGDISRPVQLLSWSIEFRIDPAEYTYSYGDGTTSGPTQDSGGPHPVGTVRHTYTQPNPAAAVKVDATLTGSYRVNGGASWIPLGGVADLQDEPVVTLEVREAKARLYGTS